MVKSPPRKNSLTVVISTYSLYSRVTSKYGDLEIHYFQSCGQHSVLLGTLVLIASVLLADLTPIIKCASIIE